MRVLIVDDDEDIRKVLALILRAEGHRVDEATDGVDALAQLAAGARPELIVVDLMMPRLDGEGLLKALHADPAVAAIPAIVTSGHPQVRQKARELGAAGCLVKPIDLDELLSVVGEVGAHAPTG